MYGGSALGITQILAAGSMEISTVAEPLTMTSGGPTQVARSVMRAAGTIPIRTVGAQGGKIGPPTCGTTPVTIGQTWLSPSRAAGIMSYSTS